MVTWMALCFTQKCATTNVHSSSAKVLKGQLDIHRIKQELAQFSPHRGLKDRGLSNSQLWVKGESLWTIERPPGGYF